MATKFPKSEKHNFNRNLVKRHKLVTHLDAFLVTEPQDFEFKYEPKKTDDGWHPSGHCTPDATDLYESALAGIEDQKYTGPRKPREMKASLNKTFMVGHFWHQLLQWAVVEMDFADPLAIERRGQRSWGPRGEKTGEIDGIPVHKPRPYHWATGSADIAPLILPDGSEYLVDFKTMGSHDFKGAGMPSWAADKYEAQINIYLDFFDMERALIVAVQKDSPHDMKEFEFVRNQPLVDAIYDKWHFVSECLDAGAAPDPLDNDTFSLKGLFKGPVAQ